MGIYTAQFKYQGPDRIDITIKSRDEMGMLFVPPNWDIINAVKAAQRTGSAESILQAERRYINEYNYALDSRRIQDQRSFDAFALLCRGHHFTFCCFCGSDQFCHRHLAAYWLHTRYGTALLGERELPQGGLFARRGKIV